jgi:hypothetical protein
MKVLQGFDTVIVIQLSWCISLHCSSSNPDWMRILHKSNESLCGFRPTINLALSHLTSLFYTSLILGLPPFSVCGDLFRFLEGRCSPYGSCSSLTSWVTEQVPAGCGYSSSRQQCTMWKNSLDYVLSMNSSVISQRKSNLQPLRSYHVYKLLPQQYHASVPTYTAQRLESHDPSAGIFNLRLTVLLLLVIVLFIRPSKVQTYQIYYLEKENYLSRRNPPLTVVALLLRLSFYR